MIDYYLKLASEADMPTVLAAFYTQDSHVEHDEEGAETVVLDGDPYMIQATADYAIDTVGIIRKATGVMIEDPDGNVYPETAAIPGWHINIRLAGNARRADVEALAAYQTNPVTPARVWF